MIFLLVIQNTTFSILPTNFSLQVPTVHSLFFSKYYFLIIFIFNFFFSFLSHSPVSPIRTQPQPQPVERLHHPRLGDGPFWKARTRTLALPCDLEKMKIERERERE
jgi:hypothetical protein